MPEVRTPPSPASWQARLAGQATRFAAVGLVNTAAAYLLFLLFLEGFEFLAPDVAGTSRTSLAFVLSYACATVCAYVLHARFTFRVALRGHLSQTGLRFGLVQAAMAGLGALLLEGGIRATGLNPRLLWFLVTGVVTLVNFVLTKRLVFKA